MSRQSTGKKGSSGLIFTTLYLAAMILLYIGERMVLESITIRLALAALALTGIAVAVIGRFVRRKKLPEAARPVENRILICYLVGVVALLLYAAQADFMMDRLRPLLDKGADRYQGVLMTLWPVLWACAMVPLIFIEISYAPMSLSRTLEPDRIGRSIRSALILSLTGCLLFVLNYILAEFNQKVDLSYFKTTRASESSRKMVRNLSEPVRAVLFFPGANEVQDEVMTFFEDLDRESKQFTVEVKDHAMDPKLAKDLSVSGNGNVVLVRDKQNQQIRIGTKLSQAKRTLKKLDAEFQKAFIKLVRSQKVAYITVGHEERSASLRDKEAGSSIRDLRTLLERMNYSIKDLGIGQGLSQAVPDDASLVIIPGPRKAFMEAELASLRAYLEKGGRMMVFLDPESEADLGGLLGHFGLKFVGTRLANERYMVRLSYSKADRTAIFSNRFSAHPSVNTLTQNSSRIATVMLGAGYLEEIPPAKGLKTNVQFTVHSMPFTWNDANQNLDFDADSEKKKVYELAAIATMNVASTAEQKNPDKKDKNKKKNKKENKIADKKDDSDNQMRLMVVADSDLLSDKVFRNPGNGYLFLDGLKWLGGEEEHIGEITSEEDVRIQHTRKEDQLWFYLTIFGVPSLVLGGGLFYTRRRRKK